MSRLAKPWMGGAAIVGVLALTACTSTTGTTAFDVSLTTEMPAAASDVDSIVWNLPNGEPTSLDPAMSAIESNSTVVANMCESLYTPTTDHSTEPGLASEIDQVDDRTYVIHLREGATFWDGTPVTPDDVVYSANRVLDESLGSSWGSWASGGIDSFAATGDNEITLKMSTPDVLVQNYFATPAFAVVKKGYAEQAGAAFGTAEGGVMCTGPYQLDAWNSGSSLTMSRYDGWWNTDVTPHIGTLKFTFTVDASAQAAGLRSGDIDGSFNLPVSTYASLSEQGNLLFGESYSMAFIPIINIEGALGDKKLRQALQASVNVQGISDSIWAGTAKPLRALVPPSAWGYSQDVYQDAWDALPDPAQDLEKAKSLVEESSYDGSTITLAYAVGNDEDTKTATVVADGAKAAGLTVELKPLQPADYAALFSADPEARAGIDAFVTAGYLDFPEPAQYYQYFTTGNYYNFTGYSNADYDAALNEALVTADDDARAALVTKAQAIAADDSVVIPLVSQYVSVYYGKDLTGLVPSPSYLYAPWAASLGGK